MATLERPAPMSTDLEEATEKSPSYLAPDVPTPFSTAELDTLRGGSSSTAEMAPQPADPFEDGLKASAAVRLSLVSLQRSCLFALNSILEHAAPTPLPPFDSASSSSDSASSSGSSTLRTIVANLRTFQASLHASSSSSSSSPASNDLDDADLAHELHERTARLVRDDLLPDTTDALLGVALAELLDLSYHLPSSSLPPLPRGESPPTAADAAAQRSSVTYFSLSEHVETLREERSRQRSFSLDELTAQSNDPWARVDELLERVASLCLETRASLEEGHPPDYHDDMFHLPRYSHEGHRHSIHDYAVDEKKPLPSEESELAESSRSTAAATSGPKSAEDRRAARISIFNPHSEKMRLELDSVANAISRLYAVAPQLADQRVELNSSKRDEMEIARMVGRGRMLDQTAPLGTTLQAAASKSMRREKELGDIWERIEKAHGRRLDGQDSIRVESSSRQKEKTAFVEDIIARNAAGRLHGQDSIPPLSRVPPDTIDPTELVTVGQFIRENVLQSATAAKPAEAPTGKASAFGSAWMSRSASGTGQRNSGPRPDASSLTMAPAIASSSSRTTLPRYTFVAELQERIRAIQVVVALHDGTAQPTLELVVSSADPRMAVLRSATTSPSSSSADQMIRIPLPAAASPITTTLSLPSPSASHYSFRLLALDTDDDDDEEDDPVSSPPPLSAMELRTHRPASLACSTCSTPVVCPTEDASYQDLPSEHWEELVGSWLCHDEMKLDLGPADGSGGAGAGGGKTFWPRQKEVLVGGTYFLVEGGLVEEASFRVRRNAETELWQPLLCAACGSPLGRRLSHASTPPTATYRLPKYAVVPLGSPGIAPSSLGSCLSQELLDLADAHRSYHFVVSAEEDEETPLVLLWLINPRLYLTSTSRPTPTRAIKVLFQLAPSSPLPAPFASAEPLAFPRAVCARLQALLEASEGEYPEGAAGMLGMRNGWLERA